MAAPNLSLIRKIPASLIVNPVSTVVNSYGGTNLGAVQDITFRPHQNSIPITAEEFGEEWADILDVGQGWTLEVTLRTLDLDSLALIFPATTAGAVSGKTTVLYPGSTYRAGTLLSASAVKLLVVPHDPGTHPCVYFPVCVPIVAQDAEEIFQASTETVVKAIFYPLRDNSSPPRVVVQGRLEDLTL